jgi:hypothetical protein
MAGGKGMTLDDLAALAEQATPGPWAEVGRDVGHDEMVAAGMNPGDARGLGCEIEGPPEAWLRGQFARHADAAYIAACSPAVIKALVAVAKAADVLLLDSGRTRAVGEARGHLQDAFHDLRAVLAWPVK